MAATFPAGAETDRPSLLAKRLKRAERLRQLRAFGLVLPLLLFMLLTFIAPIAAMLWRSVDDRDVQRALSRTTAALAGWNGEDLPQEAAFAALIDDIRVARANGSLAMASKRLNYVMSGFRTLFTATARALTGETAPNAAKQTLIAIDRAWGKRATWAAIKSASGPLTDFYLLASLDLVRDIDGAIAASPPNQAIYLGIYGRTFSISLAVTILCLILGFPVAYMLSVLPARQANLLMMLVLLPFWTSLLVRTGAWIVLLQKEGLINDSLRWLGAIEEPLHLIYNRFGVYIAMVHVLLPFMILPLYSAMKAISPSYMRAAASLGASPTVAFVRVYLPHTLPGLGAGSLFVFVLALGYYITPALIGGAGDQMISYFIALYTIETVNWGMASALGAMLLLTTSVLVIFYGQLILSQKITGGLKN